MSLIDHYVPINTETMEKSISNTASATSMNHFRFQDLTIIIPNSLVFPEFLENY